MSCAVIEGPAHSLFGGHVLERPHYDTLPRGFRHRRHLRIDTGARERQLGETEVEYFHQPVFPHHHILGLQVPVNDACRVRRRETFGDLSGYGE